ncbi:MAG: hypothetical protein EBX50_15885 [Chitinophagia bacterium]|nr:hypothetical protein [Chitinophagia bacterium]
MPIEVTKVDTFQAKLNSALINLTQLDSTTYPATTSIRIDPVDTSNAFSGTTQTPLTAYFIFDQWALRTKAV